MPINWEMVNKALYPIKDFDDLCKRLKVSFSYPFVRKMFNPTMSELIEYTRMIIGNDPRNRYDDYTEKMIEIFKELQQVGNSNLLELISKVENRETLDFFCEQNSLQAQDIASALKFLVYWFIPSEKYLGGLVRNDPAISKAIKVLREQGIRTNLDMLQQGLTPVSCQALAETSGLSITIITELVNRADLSRMPWSSKATISNIIGAGYESLYQLKNAEPEKLFEDFFRYGKSIGKNLKLGNEIENSFRIAQIVPVVLEENL